MEISVAVYFLSDDEEAVEIPRRQLRDATNVLDLTTNQ